jgi:hypothetical protein
MTCRALSSMRGYFAARPLGWVTVCCVVVRLYSSNCSTLTKHSMTRMHSTG